MVPSLLLSADQDVDSSSPAPCLPAYCYASHNDDNGLSLWTASQPQLIVVLYKNYYGHGASSQQQNPKEPSAWCAASQKSTQNLQLCWWPFLPLSSNLSRATNSYIQFFQKNKTKQGLMQLAQACLKLTMWQETTNFWSLSHCLLSGWTTSVCSTGDRTKGFVSPREALWQQSFIPDLSSTLFLVTIGYRQYSIWPS